MIKCTNKQVRRTRGWVFNALLDLLDTTDYSDIKITDIVDKAGIARQTFYRNYDCKDDIVCKYLEDLFEDYDIRNGESGILKMYDLLYANKEELQKLQKAGLENLTFDFMRKYLETFYVQLEGANAEPTYEHFNAIYKLGGLLMMQGEWIRGGMQLSPAEMEKLAAEISS